jgi:CheY-like chemotaxis protein
MSENMEIVLIEDNEDDAERILKFLRKNFKNPIKHINDGADAVEFLMFESNSSPKLILLDLVLPSVDGMEIYNLIKAEPEGRQLQVMILVSSVKSKEYLLSIGMSPDGFMKKPKGDEMLVRI